MTDRARRVTGLSTSKSAALVLFGLLTPLIAVGYELATGACRGAFFDPLPTPIHVLATVLPSIVVAWGLRTNAWAGLPPSRVRAVLWGAALGVAGWYSLLFAPLVPLSVIAIMMLGLGLLSLAPLTVLAGVWTVRPPAGTRGGWAWGFVGALAVLSLADLPAAASKLLLQRATSPDPARAASALATLRKWVPDDAIVTAAQGPISAASPLGALVHFTAEDEGAPLRVAAWRATGRVVTPRSTGFFSFAGDDDWDEWTEQGGDAVGRRVADLCLASSAVSGSVDERAGVADLRWEMTFRNDSEWRESEARTLVRLPPGGVVADATLWVAGEPRAAVFTSTQAARRAYEDVVKVERRDPLLVTGVGPDEVLVQCFPVPRNGGTMRIELRVAVPVEAQDGGRATLRLPYCVERNFSYCRSATHVVTIGGTQQTPDVEETLDGGLAVPVPFTPVEGPIWGADPFDAGHVIVMADETVAPAPPAGIVLVVDASSSTAGARDTVTAALDALAPRMPVAVVVASDDVVDATGGLVPWGPEARAAVDAAIDGVPWRGGIDATAALQHAAELRRGAPGARILWLYGRQELRIADAADPWMQESFEDTSGRWTWKPLGVEVCALRIADGDNRLLRLVREDGSATEVRGAVPATVLAEWCDTAPHTERRIRRRPATERPADAVETSEPRALAALHAVAVVDALRRQDLTGAIGYAQKYRVVTPVSGAVVLETDDDYVRAGLVDDSSPVPEPGTWAILAVVALALLVAWRRAAGGAAA